MLVVINLLVLFQASYNQDNIQEKLLSEVQRIEKKYETKYISKLVSNIDNVMDSGEKIEEILPKQLGWYGGIATIQNDTIKYLQNSMKYIR